MNNPVPTPGRRLYQSIAVSILRLIAADGLLPGQTLPAERELATRLGVSRSSVREAVISLEVTGFVEVRIGAGAVVLPRAAGLPDDPERLVAMISVPQWSPDPELPVSIDLDSEIPPFSLLQARLLIEPETAALAAHQASARDRSAIRGALAQNAADIAAGSKTHVGDRLFHIRIAQASGNPAYEITMGLLLGHRYGTMFQRLQRLYTPHDMPDRSWREHQSVMAAIDAHDADRARVAMRAHLLSVIRIFSRDPAEQRRNGQS